MRLASLFYEIQILGPVRLPLVGICVFFVDLASLYSGLKPGKVRRGHRNGRSVKTMIMAVLDLPNVQHSSSRLSG